MDSLGSVGTLKHQCDGGSSPHRLTTASELQVLSFVSHIPRGCETGDLMVQVWQIPSGQKLLLMEFIGLLHLPLDFGLIISIMVLGRFVKYI